ncbi:hypothetical protein FRB98_000582 [Tulasnella sp. 332]|nr:hypothetical protein FRB98_000582 [Tulasnella sp. 332]
MIGPGDSFEAHLPDGRTAFVTLEEIVAIYSTGDPPSPLSVTAQSMASTDTDPCGSPYSLMEDGVEKEVRHDIVQPRPIMALVNALSDDSITAAVVDSIPRPKRPKLQTTCTPHPQEYVCVHDNGRRCPPDASFRKKKSTYVEPGGRVPLQMPALPQDV